MSYIPTIAWNQSVIYIFPWNFVLFFLLFWIACFILPQVCSIPLIAQFLSRLLPSETTLTEPTIFLLLLLSKTTTFSPDRPLLSWSVLVFVFILIEVFLYCSLFPCSYIFLFLNLHAHLFRGQIQLNLQNEIWEVWLGCFLDKVTPSDLSVHPLFLHRNRVPIYFFRLLSAQIKYSTFHPGNSSNLELVALGATSIAGKFSTDTRVHISKWNAEVSGGTLVVIWNMRHSWIGKPCTKNNAIKRGEPGSLLTPWNCYTNCVTVYCTYKYEYWLQIYFTKKTEKHSIWATDISDLSC